MAKIQKINRIHPEVKPKKSLGQHFLNNQDIVDSILLAAGDLGNKTVVEVGPGVGILTKSILSHNIKKLIIIEKDQSLSSILEKLQPPELLEIIYQDVLEINFASLVSGEKLQMIANLPYNIGTNLLINLLDNINIFSKLTVMLQKEVVDRLAAKPGCKDYGKISILMQLFCEIKKEFDVESHNFSPPPKVLSSVITIVPRAKPLIEVDTRQLKAFCNIAFSARRKILKSTLQNKFKIDVSSLFKELQIDSNSRIEELSIEKICSIVNILNSNGTTF